MNTSSGTMSPTSGGYLVLVVLAAFSMGCAAPEERKCWGTPEAGLIVGYENDKPCYCDWGRRKRICIE